MKMLKLKDNTLKSSIEEPDKYTNLRNIANRPISELKDEKGNNLLIFPQSFQECEDEAGKQFIFTLEDKWEKGKCTSMTLHTGNLMGFIGIGDIQLSLNLFSLKHSTSKEPVFDFLLYLFPKFLNEALVQGLYKEYKYQEYNDANVKGTININKHIRYNVPPNGRIAYRTREFSYDNSVTQLIRHTIEYIRHHNIGRMILQNDADTQESVSRIIYATPSYNVQSRQYIIKKNIRPTHHPYFTRYTALQKLCLQILRHDGLKYGTEQNKVYGILFDGAWLWEEYLATLLLAHNNFKHPQNLKGIDAICLSGKKYPRYPDFYDKEENGIIIDAKYKGQIDTRNDINQIVTYLYRLKGRYGCFILPKENNEGTENHILLGNEDENGTKNNTLLGYGDKNKAQIYISYFPIPQIANSQKVFNNEMENIENDLYQKITELKSLCQ